MTKLAKLRNSPETFFADSKHAVVRALGTVLAPRMEGSRLVMAVLEDPRAVLREARLPLLARLMGAEERRAAARRRRVLDTAGHPTVSVIMAAHNAGATVASALASLREQTYGQLEIIVVDDASRDDTAAAVKEVAAADSRVRLVRSPRQLGAAMARNLGLSHATGAYLSFHDADDRSHPQRIERQLAALLGTSGAVVAVCNFRRETPAGERVIVNGRRFAKNVISMIFPREPVFRELGYMMDYRVGEDTEYYERIRAFYGRSREVHLFETLYFARFSPDSLLFSSGETRLGPSLSVTYDRSPESEAALEEILARMEAIRGGLDPYVALPQ